MFKVMVKVGKAWVEATQNMPRAKARRIANFYRNGYVSPNVTLAKVVKVNAR